MSEELEALQEHIATVAKTTDRNSKRTFRLQRDVTEMKSDLAEVKIIIRKYDFNGKTEGIQKLVEAAPMVLKIVDVATELLEEAEKRKNLKGFWATVARWFAWNHGVKTIIQLFLGVVAGAIITNAIQSSTSNQNHVTLPPRSISTPVIGVK